MSQWKIPLYRIYTDDEDEKIVNKVIRRGNTWAIGPEIEEFENNLREFVGMKHCVTVNSGTSALHAALLAYGIGNGDEVIVPSFSFISTANSVIFVQAKPVFADIEEQNYGLDPQSISNKITKNTKAVMPMDYAGQSCKIFEIKEVIQDQNILLIEDAAESLGASVKGKKVGSASDSAIFSFTGNKALTTGEGGAIVTNSDEIYEKLKLIRSHGRVDKTNYFDNPLDPNYVDVGYNWRMPSLIAALGISQLAKFDKIIKMRQEHAQYLNQRLAKHSQIQTPNPPEYYDHVYQMYTIRLENKQIRDDLKEFLLKKKIFCKVYFNPIHLTTYYRSKFGLDAGMLPITEKISEQILTLPLFPNMSSEEKTLLSDSIDEFFERR
jgi:dTDP-4-amino-4,6-dideoxygalactose transaminase